MLVLIQCNMFWVTAHSLWSDKSQSVCFLTIRLSLPLPPSLSCCDGRSVSLATILKQLGCCFLWQELHPLIATQLQCSPKLYYQKSKINCFTTWHKMGKNKYIWKYKNNVSIQSSNNISFAVRLTHYLEGIMWETLFYFKDVVCLMNSWCCHLAWLRENVHYSSLLSQPLVNTDLWTWLGTVPWFAQSSAATQHLKQHIKKNRWKFYLIEPTKPVHLNTISLVNQKNALIVKEPASVCEVSNPARCLKQCLVNSQRCWHSGQTQWGGSNFPVQSGAHFPLCCLSFGSPSQWSLHAYTY